MTKASEQSDSAKFLAQLKELLSDFENRLAEGDLRSKVLALVPAIQALQNLGASLIPAELATSGRDRILHYLRAYSLQIISGDELMVVAGIGEWARRVRELRGEFGWKILSGTSIQEMIAEGDLEPHLHEQDLSLMGPSDYILIDLEQDRDAAYRWNLANSIRNSSDSVRDKILKYLKANVGKRVSGEELRYVANNRTEWARRVRELRTEYGWPVVTKQTGRPDLAVGEYILEADRQTPAHDRRIPDTVRGEVLKRDDFRCTQCGWDLSLWHKADPRFLELHHVKAHQEGGENTADNLTTLCNVCHDDLHRH